jgi:hypothetical protein
MDTALLYSCKFTEIILACQAIMLKPTKIQLQNRMGFSEAIAWLQKMQFYWHVAILTFAHLSEIISCNYFILHTTHHIWAAMDTGQNYQ